MGKRSNSNRTQTQTSTPVVTAPDAADNKQARVDALIASLRVAADNKQRNEGKKIRRALRALGHTGGLRSIDALATVEA